MVDCWDIQTAVEMVVLKEHKKELKLDNWMVSMMVEMVTRRVDDLELW